MNNNKNFTNVLHEKSYIIPKGLHDSLDYSTHASLTEEPYIQPREIVKGKKGIYVVVVRVLNNNTKTIVYNYMYYDPMFLSCIMAYMHSRSLYSNIFTRELGYYLSVIDKNIIKDLEIPSLKLNSEEIIKDLEEIDVSKSMNMYYIYNIINRINYIGGLGEICKIIDLAVNKNYIQFIKLLLKDLENYEDLVKQWDSRIDLEAEDIENGINIINKCIFLVEDIEQLKSCLKSKGFDVNQGSQSWRGQVNSMSNFLNILDMDFRNSMYNHNKYHVTKGSLDPRLMLGKNKFSFKNIHMRLGNVRWYSSSTKTELKRNILNNLEYKNTMKDNSYIYNQLGEYLNNLPVNNDTQRKIEEFLLNYSQILFDKKLQDEKSSNRIIDYSLISTKLTELLGEKREILYDYLNNVRRRMYANKPSKEKDLPLFYLNNILQICNNDQIINIMYGRLFRIISSHNILNNTESNIYVDIGEDILNMYFNLMYANKIKELLNSNQNYRFSDWKDENKEIVYTFDSDEVRGNLGAILGIWLKEIGLMYSTTITYSQKERISILVGTKEILSTLKDTSKMLHLPKRLPMIVKPKPYYREKINGEIKERLGGYLLNDEKITQSLIIDKWNMKLQSTIKDENAVYDCGNNISSVGYKINRDVLDFVENNYNEYGLLTYNENLESLSTKSKLTKSEYITLESYLGKKDLQENILGIAKAYYNIHEFYIPVRIDFRGRVNCISEYLNYQSSELAKSLLLFSKPDKIYKTDDTSISYFKSYGATCYGNKMDKESWNNRIKWVDNNEYNILNYTNGVLIKNAENKLLFIAFCMEYNRFVKSLYHNDCEYFETCLPIQLDATCNGYQHLALLSSDHNLAKELNLTKSGWDEPPKDFYNFVAIKLISVYKRMLNTMDSWDDRRDGYERLFNLEITRKILKSAIMTKSYGISPLEMIKKIQESFDMVNNEENTPFEDRWCVYKLDSNIKLKIRDFKLIRKGIEEVLNDESFKLHKLINYLDRIAKILTKLGLVITWGSPSGVEINQSYLEPKEIKLKPFSYSKKSFSLKVPDKNKYNKRKQVRAFMPNIIHSLDAGSLALVVDLYFNSDNSNKNKNFFSIHDCFGVTANNVDTIKNLLKHVYTQIYSDNSYLRYLDNGIKEHIKFNYPGCLNEDTLEIKVRNISKMQFPSIEGVLGTDSSAASIILDDTYIIS